MASLRHPVRFYSVDGQRLPSVTSVIGRTDPIFNPTKENGLNFWRSREPDHRSILDEACRRGSILHSEIELAFTGRQSVECSVEEWNGLGIPDYMTHLLPTIQTFGENLVDVEKVVSSSLGYAGTADLICGFDGHTTLVDWKTTRHHSVVGEKSKKKSHYKGAEVQVAAYAAAYNSDHRNPPVTQGLIVVAYSWREPDLIRLDLDMLKHRAMEFEERLRVFQVLES